MLVPYLRMLASWLIIDGQPVNSRAPGALNAPRCPVSPCELRGPAPPNKSIRGKYTGDTFPREQLYWLKYAVTALLGGSVMKAEAIRFTVLLMLVKGGQLYLIYHVYATISKRECFNILHFFQLQHEMYEISHRSSAETH